jgi:hypothetical protein
MVVKGTNSDDLDNLWYAIVRAIYSSDPTQRAAVSVQLQQKGSLQGLVTFSQPAFDPDPDGEGFWGVGQLKIDTRMQLNS